MKKAISVLLAVIMLVSLAACGSGGTAPTPSGGGPAAPAMKDVEMLAGTSSVGYVATAISEVVTKNSPWIRMSSTGTNGTEANVSQMEEKSDTSYSVFMSSAGTYKAALDGKAAFEGKEPEKNMRLIGGFMFGVNGFCTIDPNIKTLEDLDGKTVAMVSDMLPQTACAQLFKNLGINVKIETMGFNDQFDALSDGLVDACMYFGTVLTNAEDPLVPVSSLQEVVANQKNQVWAIPIPEDLLTKAVADAGMADYWPYVTVTAAPGSLSSAQAEGFDVYGATTGCLCCWADMSDDVVYEITKTICENVELLGDYFNSIENLTAEEMVAMLASVVESEDEVHPGALKYYKEAGLWDAFENSAYAK